MTDTTISVIVAAIPLTIASLTALLVAWRTSAKTDTVLAKTDAVIAKTDLIIEKSEVIQASTNGHLQKLALELQEANAKIVEMEGVISALAGVGMKRRKDDVADQPGEAPEATGPIIKKKK